MSNKAGIGTLVNEEHELGTSALDLFTSPPVESTQIAGRNQTIYMLASINDTGPYEFIIPNDSNEYIQLDQTTLYGEVEVVKSADGAAIVDADIVSVVNNFPQAIFRQVELYLNNTCVSDLSTPTYAYKAYVENHLTYGNDIKETSLLAKELYLKDTLGKEEDVNEGKHDNTNSCGKRRAKIAGKTLCFNMPLHVDFLYSQRYLIPGVEMKIKLIKNDDTFAIFAKDNSYKIKMKKLELNIRRIVVEPEISNAIETRLSSTPAQYPIACSKIKTFLLNQQVQSQHISQIIRGKLPRSYIISFVSAKAYDGAHNKNPFVFKHFGLNYMNVFINGEPVHAKAIQPDWDGDKYLPQYDWLLKNTGLHQNHSNGITMEEFKANSVFFAYDRSPDLCNSVYKHPEDQGVIDISVSFKTPLPENVYLMIFATYDETVLIDNLRNVSISQ